MYVMGARGGAVGWSTCRRVAGSIPDGFTGIFHLNNPSGRTMALGLTQPLTEMSTRNISWGVKGSRCVGLKPYHLHVSTVLKSGNLNLLEPSGPVEACNGIALHVCNTLLPRSALFWYIAHRTVINPYRRFGTNYRSHLQGLRTDRLSRNVGKKIPLYAAWYNRRAQSHLLRGESQRNHAMLLLLIATGPVQYTIRTRMM